MTETETDNTCPPCLHRRFYSLFEYNDNISETDGNTKEVADNPSHSLQVVCTDVPSSLEVELLKLLSQKLSKNAVYFDSGSVTQFDIGCDETLETWSCYYCMLRDKEVREDGGNIKYIVCFLAPESEMLESFTHDLDIYCLTLGKKISNTTEVQSTAKCYLEKWHETLLDFLCRCVQLLERDIKFLLYCALVNGCLKVDGGKESLCSDLQRFVNMCNMSDIFVTGSTSSGSMDMLVDISSATNPQETVTLKLNNGQPQFTNTNCTHFCEHWSKAINSVNTNSPGQIRQAIEAFRAKFIHSINTIKRLLMEAESDYYAYYRAYKFLKNSGNSEILLNYAHLDDIAEVKGVFTDLKQYLIQAS